MARATATGKRGRPPRTTPVPTLPPFLDASRYAYMAEMLSDPSTGEKGTWPPSEMDWRPEEHGGRPKPVYQFEDTFMHTAADASVGDAEGLGPLVLVNSDAEVTEFARAKAAAGAIPQDAAPELARTIARCRSSGDKHWGATSSIRSPEDAEGASRVRQHYGILATPRFIHTRLLPQLQTSLANATSVDVFLRKTAISHHFVRYILREVRRFHRDPSSVRVVELYGPPNDVFTAKKGLHLRNAWMNLEVLRFWRAEYEAEEAWRGRGTSTDMAELDADRRNRSRPYGTAHPATPLRSLHAHDWYSVMDDDGYALLESLRTALAQFQRSTRDWREKAVFVGYNIHGFAHGGPGMHFNVAAMERLNHSHLDFCYGKFSNYGFDAGDAIAGHCMLSRGISLVTLPHIHYHNPAGTVRSWWDYKSPYPAGFHEVRTAALYYRIAELVSLRERRGELVTWDDVIVNLAPNGTAVLKERYEHCFRCIEMKCGYRIPPKRA